MINNYSNLPIGKYLELIEVLGDESREAIDRNTGCIAVLADMEEEDLLNLPITEYKELSDNLAFMSVAPPKPNPNNIQKVYHCGKFDLVPNTDIKKMTASQYIDYQNFAKTGELSALPLVLSTLMIPQGKKYCEGYDPTEVQDAIRKHLCVIEVNNLDAFFLTRWIQSIRGILIYCRWKTKDRKVKMKITKTIRSLRSGDGLLGLIALRKPVDAVGTKYGAWEFLSSSI